MAVVRSEWIKMYFRVDSMGPKLLFWGMMKNCHQLPIPLPTEPFLGVQRREKKVDDGYICGI